MNNKLLLLKNKKVWISISICLISLLAMLAYTAMQDMKGQNICQTNIIVNSFSMGTGIWGIVTAIALWYVYKQDNKRLKKISAIFGLIFSFTYTIGYMFQWQNDVGNTGKEWFMALGMILVFIPVPMAAFMLLTNLAETKLTGTKWKILFFEKVTVNGRWKTIFIHWGIFFTSFVPAFLAYFPAVLAYDARYQFAQTYNNIFTTHHPLIHTLLFKLCYKFGNLVNSGNAAFALFSILQMLSLSFAFAYAIGYLREIGVSRKICIIITIFLIVNPMNAIYSISFTKDTFFAAFFMLFVISLLRFAGAQIHFWPQYVFFIGVTATMILLRNNALYALLAMIPFLVKMLKNKRKKIVILLILSIFLAMTGNTAMKKISHATDNSSTKETFSLLLQQVARTYTYTPESQTQPAMQEITNIIPAEYLTWYNPYLSDPVKGNLDNTAFKNNLGSFIKNWAKLFFQYPDDYIEAFLCNTMGYWYLDDTAHARIYGEGGFLVVNYDLEPFCEQVSPKNYCPIARKYFDALFDKNGYQNIPLLSVLFRPAVVFFAYLICILQLIYRKTTKFLLVLIPVIAYFLTVLLGPVVLIRYIYCLICVLPFAICWILHQSAKDCGQ